MGSIKYRYISLFIKEAVDKNKRYRLTEYKDFHGLMGLD